jgi:hypothetical protein
MPKKLRENTKFGEELTSLMNMRKKKKMKKKK